MKPIVTETSKKYLRNPPGYPAKRADRKPEETKTHPFVRSRNDNRVVSQRIWQPSRLGRIEIVIYRRETRYSWFSRISRQCFLRGRFSSIGDRRRTQENNRHVRTQRLCMYTWAERSVMRCSQACVAVYLRTERPRSIPRRCPSTCSCLTVTRSTKSRWTRPGSRRPETAINPRRFPSPCRGTAACKPAGT